MNNITGESKINGNPVKYLADTGSNRTFINKNRLNVNDDLHGYLQIFKHKVVTAEGQKTQIMSVKSCLIQIGNWKCIIEVLEAESFKKQNHQKCNTEAFESKKKGLCPTSMLFWPLF